MEGKGWQQAHLCQAALPAAAAGLWTPTAFSPPPWLQFLTAPSAPVRGMLPEVTDSSDQGQISCSCRPEGKLQVLTLCYQPYNGKIRDIGFRH